MSVERRPSDQDVEGHDDLTLDADVEISASEVKRQPVGDARVKVSDYSIRCMVTAASTYSVTLALGKKQLCTRTRVPIHIHMHTHISTFTPAV